jgi:hypothetical protein
MSFQDADWPYVCYTKHPYSEVQDWCWENIGEFNQDWYKLGEDILASLISDYKSTYMFRKEEHAVLFQLRWS